MWLRRTTTLDSSQPLYKSRHHTKKIIQTQWKQKPWIQLVSLSSNFNFALSQHLGEELTLYSFPVMVKRVRACWISVGKVFHRARCLQKNPTILPRSPKMATFKWRDMVYVYSIRSGGTDRYSQREVILYIAWPHTILLHLDSIFQSCSPPALCHLQLW